VTKGFSKPGSVRTKSLRDASRQPTGAPTYRVSGLRLLVTTERLETEPFISHHNLSKSPEQALKRSCCPAMRPAKAGKCKWRRRW
jgi:hypothetical protein